MEEFQRDSILMRSYEIIMKHFNSGSRKKLFKQMHVSTCPE
jgi:hypothetical protein